MMSDRAALYHRVSTIDQHPDAAREQLRAAAQRRGFQVALEVEETGSGANNDRPGLLRVMDAARRGQIDAVLVTTPNHSHATIAINAMKRGKHCYCEKPLAHSIHEVRAMNRVANEQKVVTQMGTQNHAGENYRRTVELIQSGAIGGVKQVHVWFGRPGGWRRYKHVVDRPKEPQPIPKTLNWDLWVGPAPMQHFHPCYHPHDWHYWWDFGNGTIGNMGCHYMDLIFWSLGLRYPTTVETKGPERHPDSTPFWLVMKNNVRSEGSL